MRSAHRPPRHVLHYLQEIARLDDEIRAFLPEPGREERLGRESLTVDAAGPLEGLPIAIKDIVHVDGMDTGCGSDLPPELFAGPEAPVVRRLRAAGGVVLGKTRCTEFAVMAPCETRNPVDLARTPGGSSSGSAAAVAAGMAPAAIGSQTTGSVIRPAAYCGVLAFKPSFDRSPTAGFVPVAPSLDHPGWFAGTTSVLEVLSSVLVDDWRGPYEANDEPLAIAVPRGPFLEHADARALEAFEADLRALRDRGHAVVDVEVLGDFDELCQRQNDLMAGEFARGHAPWFEAQRARYRDATRGYLERGSGVTDERVEACRASRLELRERFARIAEARGVALWISPAAPGPAPRGLASTGSPVMNVPWTHAGMPTANVPSGRRVDGLPLGLQVAAGFGADEELTAAIPRILAAVSADTRR